jgi:hypothetical protein
MNINIVDYLAKTMLPTRHLQVERLLILPFLSRSEDFIHSTRAFP